MCIQMNLKIDRYKLRQTCNKQIFSIEQWQDTFTITNNNYNIYNVWYDPELYKM